MTPLEFGDWIKEYKGLDWYDKMKLKSNYAYSYNIHDVIEIIEELEQIREKLLNTNK